MLSMDYPTKNPCEGTDSRPAYPQPRSPGERRAQIPESLARLSQPCPSVGEHTFKGPKNLGGASSTLHHLWYTDPDPKWQATSSRTCANPEQQKIPNYCKIVSCQWAIDQEHRSMREGKVKSENEMKVGDRIKDSNYSWSDFSLSRVKRMLLTILKTFP